MTAPLTTVQYRVLSFIELYIDTHGFSPTFRDICQHTGLRSTSSVAHQLNVLEAKGRIRRGQLHGSPRTIALVQP